MMENPLVSVMINTYNHKDYIAQAIESVLMQKTTFPFEIVIGEDESNDGTREICVEYAKKYPNKIRLFLRSRKDVIYINGNPTGRYNFTENLKSAKGKYVALLPGDDYWTDPKKLQKQVDFLKQNPECVACHHWHQYSLLDENGKYILKEAPIRNQGYYPKYKSCVREIFANKMRVKSRTLMFRNVLELPDWFNKPAFGDVPLSMLLGEKGLFGFIDESMAAYRQTGKGVSSMGKGDRWFIRDHYYKWIDIWEIGLIHFDYKYSKEAIETIKEFYSNILKKYKYSSAVVFFILRNSVVRSELRLNYRLKISAYMVVHILGYKLAQILRCGRRITSYLTRIINNPIRL